MNPDERRALALTADALDSVGRDIAAHLLEIQRILDRANTLLVRVRLVLDHPEPPSA